MEEHFHFSKWEIFKKFSKHDNLKTHSFFGLHSAAHRLRLQERPGCWLCMASAMGPACYRAISPSPQVLLKQILIALWKISPVHLQTPLGGWYGPFYLMIKMREFLLLKNGLVMTPGTLGHTGLPSAFTSQTLQALGRVPGPRARIQPSVYFIH